MKEYSRQPRKQRLAGFNLNAHERGRAMSAHLSDELLKEYSRIRSLTVRKGDTVKVVRGAFKGQVAKVIKVFPRKGMISIEEATLTKADNKKVARLFRPSKVIITKLDLADPWRREKLSKFKVPGAEEKKEEPAEKKPKEEKAERGEKAEKAEKAERGEKGEKGEKGETEKKEAPKAEHKEAPKHDHKEPAKAEHKEAHSKEASK